MRYKTVIYDGNESEPLASVVGDDEEAVEARTQAVLKELREIARAFRSSKDLRVVHEEPTQDDYNMNIPGGSLVT